MFEYYTKQDVDTECKRIFFDGEEIMELKSENWTIVNTYCADEAEIIIVHFVKKPKKRRIR